jgi:putative hemolysin
MNALWVLAFLIVLSGFFSLAEMALASARRGRLTQMAAEGNKGAAAALIIKEHPSRLLAATQTGITAAALLMGIYGESALSASIKAAIPGDFPMLGAWREPISFIATIVMVTAASIVLGDRPPGKCCCTMRTLHVAFHSRVVAGNPFSFLVG